MRRGIVFATDLLDPLPALAREAESAGFDRVWTTEYPGRDALVRALAIGLGTQTIDVGTGVAYAFSRSVLAMAAIAVDVHRLSGERFALGISAGTRGVRRWYDSEFEPPAVRMRDYVLRLRDIWTDADTYPVVPRVYLPAFHSVMTRHAAGVADGLLLHPLAAVEHHLRERIIPAIERGSRGRDTPLELVAWRITSIDDDEDTARSRAARQIAFYLSTPSYAVALEGTTWSAVPVAVRQAAIATDGFEWDALARLIPDSLVDELSLAGRPADVARRFADVAARLAPLGVTELVAQTVGAGIVDDDVVMNCRRMIRSLKPEEVQ